MNASVVECSLNSQEGESGFQRIKRQQSLYSLCGKKRVKMALPQEFSESVFNGASSLARFLCIGENNKGKCLGES